MSAGNFRNSFGFKIFRAFGLAILAVSLVFTSFLVYYQNRAVKENLVKDGKMLAGLLSYGARTWVFAENREMLQTEAQGFMGQENVVAVLVYNAEKSLIYAEQKRPFAGRSQLERSREKVSALKPAPEGVMVIEGDHVLSFIAPVVLDHSPGPEELIYLNKPAAKAESSVIGYVEVVLDANVLRHEMKAILLRNALFALAFLLFGGIAIYGVISRVTAPLTRLTSAVRDLGRGETVERVPIESRDEIGRLAMDFNTMSENLLKREEEKRALEERLRHAQKMEAVGTLARGIAHDFNNILATVRGSLYIIERRMQVPDSLKHYVEKIHTSINKAQSLIQGLITFSRTQTANLQPLDLNALVLKARPMLSSIVGDSVELSLSPCEGELMILADAFQLEQVLMNLSSNARDAMPDGGRLAIATERRASGPHDPGDSRTVCAECAVLTVSDSGTGMDEETRSRIFEPFFTTKEPGKGTGLGLSIVYGIIQQHRGRIELQTGKSSGTVFSIHLPLAPYAGDELSRTDNNDFGGEV